MLNLTIRLKTKTRNKIFDDLLSALQISWLVISSIVSIVILSWIIFGDVFIDDLSKHIQINHSRIKCFFCGMTKAFLEIRDANFFKAIQDNENSVQAFFFLLSNQVLYTFFLIKKMGKQCKYLD
jgi:hypothetical protein